jgi:hypothetical protein
MLAYIEKIAQSLIELLRFPIRVPMQNRLQDVSGRMIVLAEELNRLDPREFEPPVQFDFVEARRKIRSLSHAPQDHWERSARYLRDASEDQRTEEISHYSGIFGDARAACEEVIRLLACHRGAIAGGAGRSFAFIKDAELREAIERDYRELAHALMPGAAWRSAVVLAGSILAAIVYHMLTANAGHVSRAMKSLKAPRKKDGGVRDLTQNVGEDEWQLGDLVRVAVDLGLLPVAQVEAIAPVVRDYRSFLHPRKEIRAVYPCTEAEALLAKGALDAVCNQLG